jgi:hypothetical protein
MNDENTKPDGAGSSSQVASDASRQDSRTFKELSTIWGGTTRQRPELLLEALVQAFWRGEFERDVRLVPGTIGDVYEGYTAITAEIQPSSALRDRSAGSYATRFDGVIVKVGNDGILRPTAERTEIKIYRDAIARASDIPDWDGWNEPGAGTRPVPERAFRDFSGYKVEQWSRTTIEMRYECWRITRRDFAEWYGRWPYGPLAKLEKFWPPIEETVIRSNASQKKRGAKPSYDWVDVEAYVHQLMNEHGDFRPWDSEWKAQADLERAVAEYLEKQDLHPAESTIRERVGPMIKRWLERQEKAGN